jgi:hypothetical protein
MRISGLPASTSKISSFASFVRAPGPSAWDFSHHSDAL